MVDVLESQRAAMRFRVLVEIADRQPAVSQEEIAEALGVTSQAVSEYIRQLIHDGYVEREGRSRYGVTKEGVDWLLSSAADVRRYADHVTEDVLGGLDTDAAIAAVEIDAGEDVGLRLEEGLLTADPRETDGATGRASAAADPGEVVAVTNFEGVMELEPGQVTVYRIPSIRHRDEAFGDPSRLGERAAAFDLMVATGVEAVVAIRAAELTPDGWFAPGPVAADAAARGLDVFIVTTIDELGRVTDALRDAGIAYEVTDGTD